VTDAAACVAVMRAVADGTIRVEKFACWIREHIALITPPLKPRSEPDARLQSYRKINVRPFTVTRHRYKSQSIFSEPERLCREVGDGTKG
jgi:hypothetical protein